jgi:hypothetical protein
MSVAVDHADDLAVVTFDVSFDRHVFERIKLIHAGGGRNVATRVELDGHIEVVLRA